MKVQRTWAEQIILYGWRLGLSYPMSQTRQVNTN